MHLLASHNSKILCKKKEIINWPCEILTRCLIQFLNLGSFILPHLRWVEISSVFHSRVGVSAWRSRSRWNQSQCGADRRLLRHFCQNRRPTLYENKRNLLFRVKKSPIGLSTIRPKSEHLSSGYSFLHSLDPMNNPYLANFTPNRWALSPSKSRWINGIALTKKLNHSLTTAERVAIFTIVLQIIKKQHF